MEKGVMIYMAEPEDIEMTESGEYVYTASVESMEKVISNAIMKGKERAEVIKMVMDQKQEESYQAYKKRLLEGEE